MTNDQPVPPAQSLLDVLKAVSQSQQMWTQLAADVAALKIVVSAFSPEAKNALEEQTAKARDKFQEIADPQRLISEMLRTGFPKKVDN